MLVILIRAWGDPQQSHTKRKNELTDMQATRAYGTGLVMQAHVCTRLRPASHAVTRVQTCPLGFREAAG
eukprot:8659102-Alexandrium_andersonii.AAC.1